MIQVGQKVHCILYGGKDGIVVEIHGEQSPGTVNRLAGIVATGGSAYFDILWENGTQSLSIPEAILLGGIQWKVYEGQIATPDEIAQAKELFCATEARKKAEQEESNRKFTAEKDRLLSQFPYLKRVSQGEYPLKTAASNIRKELKLAFPKVKFSVTCSRSSVNIHWTDGPVLNEVAAITGKYEGGSFDGMTDSYTHRTTPWTSLFGEAGYVHNNRSISDGLMALALEKLFLSLPGNMREVVKKSPSEYSWSDKIPGLNMAVLDGIAKIAKSWNTLDNTFKPGPHDYDAQFLIECLEKSSNPAACPS